MILRPFGLASASLQLVWSGCGRNARRAANIAIDAADRARTASADAISPHHIAAAVKATKLLDL